MPSCELCGGRGGRTILARDGGTHWVKCPCVKDAGLTPEQAALLKHPGAPTDQLAMPTNQPVGGQHMARRKHDDDDDREPRRRKGTATETRRRSPNGRARTRREEYTEEPGWGSLFHRPDNEGNQPAYTGQGLDIDGNPVELAIWIRKSRSGKKYLRIHIQEPYEADDAGGDLDEDDDDEDEPRARRRRRDPDENDNYDDEEDDEGDIPF